LLKIKTFKEYHDFYLNIDVYGFTDVFENFRKTTLEYYELEPCNYDYDQDMDNTFISYLDANILYGHAMNRPLPYKDLKWVSEGISIESISSYHEKSDLLVILTS